MRKANRQSKRDQILKAALEAFSDKGYHRSTIAEVANRAKVAAGSVYVYFKSKEELLQCCIIEFIALEIDRIILITSEIADPLDRLYEFFRIHGELLETKPNVAMFLAVESHHNEMYLHSHNKAYRHMKRYFDYVKPIGTNAVEKGKIRNVDSSTLAHVLVGSMDYMLWQTLAWDDSVDFENLVKQMVHIMKLGFQKKIT